MTGVQETGTAVMLPGASAVALALPGDLSYEEWQASGHMLARVGRASSWWIGDWLLFGEDRFGEVAAQAVDELGLDVQTISNYRWISRTYPPTSREENLTWRHHFDAAGLDVPARTALLARAKNEGLSTRVVRAEANRLKQIAKNGGVLEPSVPEVHATNEGNTTALCEILADVMAGMERDGELVDGDPAWVRWQIARGLAEHGVLACDALTGRDVHALVSVPGTQEFRSLFIAIARQGPT